MKIYLVYHIAPNTHTAGEEYKYIHSHPCIEIKRKVASIHKSLILNTNQ